MPDDRKGMCMVATGWRGICSGVPRRAASAAQKGGKEGCVQVVRAMERGAGDAGGPRNEWRSRGKEPHQASREASDALPSPPARCAATGAERVTDHDSDSR